MKLNYNKVLNRTLVLYRQKKRAKNFTIDEVEEINKLPSDQIESLAQAICEEINKQND